MQTADPLAYFLFTRRKGYCEYFASAMAVMLRTLGSRRAWPRDSRAACTIPITDLWLVRASDAHSWVEAWIPGRGWTTFDPTPPDSSPPPRPAGESRAVPGCRPNLLAGLGGGLRPWAAGHPGRPHGTRSAPRGHPLVRRPRGAGIGLAGLPPAVPARRAGGLGCWRYFWQPCGCWRPRWPASCGFAAGWSGSAGAGERWPTPRCSTSACCRP